METLKSDIEAQRKVLKELANKVGMDAKKTFPHFFADITGQYSKEILKEIKKAICYITTINNLPDASNVHGKHS